MRTLLTKTALTVGFVLAMAFTFSCSSDDGNDNPPPSAASDGSSSSGGIACATWGDWVITPATCEANGVKTRSCTSGTSSPEAGEVAQLAWGDWEITIPATATAGQAKRTCPTTPPTTQIRELRKCGVADYTPDTQFCHTDNTVKNKCGGTLVFDPATEKCCGSSKYAFATQICDTRDRNLYKFVSIGTGATAQKWMAENLNYNADGSKCGDGNSLSNTNTATCDTYGRLYDWATAMEFESGCNTTSCSSQIDAKHKGVCPEGWHIPSGADWNVLMRVANPDCSSDSSVPSNCSDAGTKLKTTSGWNPYDGIPTGTDDFGFSALPSGYGRGSSYIDANNSGRWWSANEDNADYDYAYYLRIYYDYRNVDYYSTDGGSKSDLFSVRCLQDSP